VVFSEQLEEGKQDGNRNGNTILHSSTSELAS